MQTIFLAICAYLCGSIPTGKLVGRLRDIDIQKHGSGNIGFANAVRVLGWRLGVIVLVGDVLKGFVPLLIAKQYFGLDDSVLLAIGLLPIIGHAHSVWLKFRGGKSIATGLGVLLVLAPAIAICGVVTYCLVFAMYRRSALGSLVGTWSLPLWALALQPGLIPYLLVLAVFATYTHRHNIRSLVKAYAG